MIRRKFFLLALAFSLAATFSPAVSGALAAHRGPGGGVTDDHARQGVRRRAGSLVVGQHRRIRCAADQDAKVPRTRG